MPFRGQFLQPVYNNLVDWSRVLEMNPMGSFNELVPLSTCFSDLVNATYLDLEVRKIYCAVEQLHCSLPISDGILLHLIVQLFRAIAGLDGPPLVELIERVAEW